MTSEVKRQLEVRARKREGKRVSECVWCVCVCVCVEGGKAETIKREPDGRAKGDWVRA